MTVYRQAAKSFVGLLGIKRVIVGGGYSDLDLSSFEEMKERKKTPKGVYTDAGRTQYLLSGKE